jgi:hypothetical protein
LRNAEGALEGGGEIGGVGVARGEGRLQAAKASRYLVQLCKHFNRKAPSEWDEHLGLTTFTMRVCQMTADERELVLLCATVKAIVEDHRVRFAWREEPTIAWTALDDEPVG